MQTHQEKMKNTFDKRVKEEQFQIDDLVLKWDAPKEDKHGKFDHMLGRSLCYCRSHRGTCISFGISEWGFFGE